MNERRGTPWHLWVVGIVSLLWHAGGANDYIQTQLANADYLAAAAEMTGVSTQTMIAYFESRPLWFEFAWAIGIWGAVLGSILLLLRSGFAYYVFILSFLGTVASFSMQFSDPMPGTSMAGLQLVMTVAIFAIEIFLILYSRAMARRGVLR
ncbi:hypothetical protein [Qipengyuania sp. JC766]|uniref:hypothetical protein n=1 Tax=Qipengyuania sp. JC766 TaxID=3232139 RepID=UPI003458E46E